VSGHERSSIETGRVAAAVKRLGRGVDQRLAAMVALPLLFLLPTLQTPEGKQAPGSAPAELAGIWIGHPSHNGETSPIVLRLEIADQDKLTAKMSTPAIHVWEFPVGPVTIQGNEIRIGALGLVLVYDRDAGTLTGTLPAALVPVYSMRVTFHRTGNLQRSPRPEPVQGSLRQSGCLTPERRCGGTWRSTMER
jgi:hypothetical protein